MSQHTIKGQLTKEGFNVRTWKDAKGNNKMSMDFVIDYSNNGYSNKLLLQAVGQKSIEEMNNAIGVGEKTFHFKVTSNDSNGKWFTTAKVWRLS